MILNSILFSLLAGLLIWTAGRRDVARDPWLTLSALALLALFPLLLFSLPKVEVLPPRTAGEIPALPSWWPWVWATGVALGGLRLTAALAQLCIWRLRSRPVETSNEIPVRILPGLTSPIAAGIFYPVIFVPPAWEEWSDSTREAVLAHETKHHRRRDPLWRTIAAAACTIHWYNPLVWWMARRLSEQCEYACDEAVLADGMQRERYAHVLCDLASSPRSPATTLAMAHHSGLESRVKRMFRAHPERSQSVVMALLIFMLVLATGLVVISPAAPPAKSAVPLEEIRTRLEANPFPGG